MELSGRLLGFISWSMLLPAAAAGVASVLVLHRMLRRWAGDLAAHLSALALALAPVAVLLSRLNDPDALVLIIGSGQPVITIGGLNGSDPAPTLAQFRRLAAQGKVRSVLVPGNGLGAGGGAGGGGPGSSTTGSQIAAWTEAHGTQVSATDDGSGWAGALYALSAYTAGHTPVEPEGGAAMEETTADRGVVVPPPYAACGGWPPPGPGGAEPPPAGRTGRPTRAIVVAGVGALVVGVGGFLAIRAATAHASTSATNGARARPGAGQLGPGGAGFPGGSGGPGGGPGGGTAGTINSINGDTLILTTPNGSMVKVVASSSTTITTASPGSVSDIHPGDHVVVMGTTSGSSTALTPARITDSGSVTAATGAGPLGAGGPPPGAGSPAGTTGGGSFGFAEGTVSTVNGSTLAITESSGATVSVTTSSATSVTTVSPASLAALSTGQDVRVVGTTAGDGTVAATAIMEGQDAGPRSGFGPPGRAPAAG